MANEISTSFSFSCTKGSLTLSRSFSKQITMSASAPNVAGGTQLVGTTHEAIVLGDVATNGCAYFVNLDATNYLEIGVLVSGTFYPVVRLNAGEGALARIAQGVTPYAKANTAAVVMEYHLLDN